MAAVVAGNSLGLSNTSLFVLGAQGALGSGAQGRAGERVYVNSATGNLVMQNRDELVLGRGPDLSLLRTYNSQGLLNDDNGDNWRLGIYRRVFSLTGTANTAGSTVRRLDADGAESVYTFNTTLGKYVCSEGEGAYDTLAFNSATQTWTWTDGDTQVTERYDAANGGRITQVLDTDGNGLTFTYNATSGLITQVSDASGETTFLDYTGTNLTQLRTVKSGGQTLVRTRYAYDTSNRLIQVTTDLSPDDASVVDNNVYTVNYTYDGTSKRIASLTQTDGNNLSFTYGVDGRLASYTDANSKTTSITYTQGTASLQTSASANNAVLSTTETQTTTSTVAPYYTVTSTDTWTSITQAVYGTNNPNAVAALQAALNNPTLSAGLRLTVPATLNYNVNTTNTANSAVLSTTQTTTTTVAPYYTVNATDTWASITQTVYGTSNTDAVAALQAALGNPALSAGLRLTVPQTLTYGGGTTAPASAAALSTTLTTTTTYNLNTSALTASTTTPAGWGTAALVAGSGTVSAKAPQVKFDPNGNGMAVWATDTDVFYSLYNKVNDSWSAAQTLDGTLTGSVGDLHLSMSANGNALVTWGQGGTTYARRYVAGVWDEVTAIPFAGGSTLRGAINDSGRAVVAFIRTNGAFWGVTTDIYASVYDGSSWSASANLDDAGGANSSFVSAPSVAIDPLNNATVLWIQKRVDSTAGEYLFHSRFTASAGNWSMPNYTLFANNAVATSIAFDGNGNGIAISQQQDAFGSTLYAKSYTRSTDTWSATATALATAASGAHLSMSANGNALVTWTDGSGNILARRYAAGAWLGTAPEAIENAAGAASNPTGAINDAGQAAVSFVQANGTVNDILVNRFANGAWQASASPVESNANSVTAQNASVAIDARGNTATFWLQKNGLETTDSVYRNRYSATTFTYTIPSGATWSSIAQTLYGTTTAASALQSALGNPPLVAGNQLTGFPEALTVTTTSTVAPYYTVQANDTWSSIAQAVYGDKAAAGPLQAALGNPALAAGVRLTVPGSVTYNPIAASTNAAALTTTETQTTTYSLNTGAIGGPTGTNVLQNWTPVTGLSAATNALLQYTIQVPPGQSELVVTTTGGTGDADLFVRFGAAPAWSLYDATSGSSGNNEEVLIRNPATGTWYVAVGAFSTFSGVKLQANYQSVPSGTIVLQPGTAASDLAGNGDADRLFSFDIPAGTASFNLALTGAAGQDADLFLRFGAPPDTTYDFSSTSVGMNESIRVNTPQAGTWYAAVRGFWSGYADAKLLLSTNLGTNTPPAAEAGAGKNVTAGTAVSLTATGSDAQGAVTYQWTQIGGPSVTLTNATSATASFTAPTVSSPTLLDFRVRVTDGQGASNTDIVHVLVRTPTGAYIVGSGDTWASIATKAYGSSAAASALQQALGNPALTVGAQLTGFPPTLSVTSTITVAPYYLVKATDTWTTIAQAVYGSGEANAAMALRDALANPALTAGLKLTVPASIRYSTAAPVGTTTSASANNVVLSTTLTTTTSVAPYYTVTSTDTWATITQSVYATNNANAVGALQTALGNPALTAGLRLTVPATLSYNVANSAAANSAVLSTTVTTTTTTTVAPYYTVQAGNTWDSITQTVYGTNHANALAALQTATGNPALTTGLHLTVPLALNYSISVPTTVSAEITDPLGLKTTLFYDGKGQIVRALSPAIGTTALETRYAYDAMGNVTQVTDGKGNVVTYGYDGNGNRTLERDAAGNTVTRTYGAKDELLTETVFLMPDPDGAGIGQPATPSTARDVYDGENHLRFVVSAEGRVTEYRYNDFGQQIAAIQYTGNLYPLTGLTPGDALTETQLNTWVGTADKSKTLRTDSTYDFRGQLDTTKAYASVDAAGNGVVNGTESVRQYVYDQAGSLLRTVDPRGVATTTVPNDFTTTYVYDGLGRVLSTVDALGRTTLTQYQDANRKTVLTFANGLASTSTYDATGNLVSVLQSSGSTTFGETKYFYDAGGRLRRTEDPTGIKTHILYDELSRKIGEIDGDGSLTEYRYDAASNLTRTIRYATAVSITNLNSLTDAITGKPTTVALAAIRPASTPQDRSTWNAYDTANRLVKSVDEAGAATQYFYDGADRVTDMVRFATLIATATLGDTPAATSINPPSSAADRLSRNLYDADGTLRGNLDGEGYLVEYKYDAAGQLVETVGYATATTAELRTAGTLAQLVPAANAADIRSYFFYNAKGQAAGTVDAEGYLTETVYDLAGNKTQVIRYATKVTYTAGASVASLRPAANAQDRTSTYTYDALNRVVSETNFEGTLTQYTYDEVGNLTRTVKAASTAEVRTLLAQYDKQGRLAAELSAKGAALLTGGETQAQIDAIWAAHAVKHAYDAAGRRTSTTDANGKRTLFFYNADGALTHTVNAQGEVKESGYNALGQLTQTIAYGTRIAPTLLATLSGGLNTGLTGVIANALLDSKTSYAYALTGALAQKTDPLGNAVTQAFNAFGELASSTQAIDGGLTFEQAYSYDRRGLLTQTRGDPSGINASASTVYDAFGRAIQSTDARGNVRMQSYDRLGRVVTGTDALNQATSTTYDAFDGVLTRTDALGKVTRYSYNAASRSVTVTTPENIATTTVNNRHGETISVTDGRSNTTTYSYDANGNLTGVTAPAVGTVTSAYDNANLLIETTDALGTKTSYTYDAANRVLTRTLDPGAGRLNLVTAYAYDAKGRTISVTDPAGVVTETSYDLKGQVTQVVLDTGAGRLNLATTYTYDARGKTLRVTEGAGSAQPRVTEYAYDKLGRRTSERLDPAGISATTTYAYDKNDNVVRRTDALGNVTRYTYDANDRLVHAVDALGGVTKNEYDANGRLIRFTAYATPISLASLTDASSVADIAGRIVPSTSDQTKGYVYDGDGRELFCIDSLGGVKQKAYDGNGNLVREVQYANRISTSTALTPAAVNAALALVASNANDRVTRTVYDAANRAIFTIDAAGFVTQFFYDGNGNAIKQIGYATAVTAAFADSTPPPVAASASDRTTRSVYDAAGRMRYGVDAEAYVTERRFDALGHETSRIRYADKVVVADGATTASMAALLPVSVPATAVVEQARYDNVGRLVEIVDGLNNVTRNTYDAAGRKTDVTRAFATAAASTTRYAYDALGRVLEETRGFGTAAAATTRYVLDALGNRIKVIDPRGVELAETDSAWALATRKALGYVDALSAAKLAAALTTMEKDALRVRYTGTQQFDALGRAIRSTDATGGVTQTAYDAFGNAVKITDPRGNSGYFYFDARNQAVLHVDPEGYATQSVYDAFGNVTQTIRRAARVSGAVAVGQPPTIVADALRDQTTLTEYDKRDLKLKVTDGENFFEQYTYDAFGNKTSYRNQLGGLTSYTYDRVGNLLSETLPVGSIVNRFEYDARGNRTKQIEASALPEQRVTLLEYDKLDRQVKKTGQIVHVFDPASSAFTATASPVEQQKYDARGNLIETIAANGARTLTYYDALDRKIAEIGPPGALTVWQYNSGKGPTAELRYGDPVAQPASPGGTSPAPVNAANVREKRFTYDANNALVETRVPSVRLGEQALGTTVFSDFVQDVVTKSFYDAAGNEVQKIDGRGNATFSYYDRVGQKILEVDAERYVTRWERDASGDVVRETKYAKKLSLVPGVASDPLALIANVDTAETDPVTGLGYDRLKRVTELDYDRMNRVIEQRVLNVEYGTVSAAISAPTTASANARTLFKYNGLGQVIQQTDATGAVSDIGYDLAGRKTREQGAQFTDFENALVRPTTDYEYDGLNQVRRELVRGKDTAVETDDRITSYQYDYGFGARRIGQTDATGATTNFFYDVAGNLASRSIVRTDADSVSVTDRLNYTYDLLGRELLHKDVGTGQVNETRYNVFGEITGKRTYVGTSPAAGAWQEVAEYDKMGRVWKNNSGDGVFKVYLYDANGNSTLTIQSAGPDFSDLTLDQVMALPGSQKFLTVSQYDARNQLSDTYQPRMNSTQEQASVEQFVAVTAGVPLSGGGVVSVGPLVQTTSKPADVFTLGAAAALPATSVQAQVSLRYWLNPNIGWRFQNWPHSSVYFWLPDVSQALGDDAYEARIVMAGITGAYTYLPGYDGVVPNVSGSNTFLEFRFAEGGSWSADVDSPYVRSIQVYLYKKTGVTGVSLPVGSFSISTAPPPHAIRTDESGNPVRDESGNLQYEPFPIGYPNAVGDTVTWSSFGTNEIYFRGQADARRLVLQYRLQGSTTGWSTFSVPEKIAGAGWFAFNPAAWGFPAGTYDIRYSALGADGGVIHSQSGTMVVGATPSITAPAQATALPVGGAGRAFMDTNWGLNILEQGATAQSLTVHYRKIGTTPWLTSVLTPAPIAGVATPGWFVFSTATLSGDYEYVVEAKNAAGTQLNKARGTFTAGVANSVSPLTALKDMPRTVQFFGQPGNAASMKLSYRPLNSTGAYSAGIVTKDTGQGVFLWDANGLAPDEFSNYSYEYAFEVFDAGNTMINKAHGTVTLGANPSSPPPTADPVPGEVRFNPPQANARKLVLQYRTAGSTGAFTSVTLLRASDTAAFVWKLDGVAVPGATVNLDYFYELKDAADLPVQSADGNPVRVDGELRLGNLASSTELKWVVVGTSIPEWSIHRRQTRNAFGEVAQEIDGLARITDFSYNVLGLLAEKRSPATEVTLATGDVQTNVRPTTRYTYDLSGRLVAVTDPNGNANKLQLLAGSGRDGQDARVLAEFHADGGTKLTAYDVFGDARRLTDEINRITLQEFDKLGRLTRIVRPARAPNTPGNETAAAVSAVELYFYDQMGNRIRHTNALNGTDRTYYDSLGRVTATKTPSGNATTYAYAYDATILGVGGMQVGGWLKTTTDAIGKTLQDKQDLFGRVTFHKDQGEHTFTYNYNHAGRLTSQTGSTGQNIVYDYYANGYIKSIDDRAIGSFTKYEYDAEGNRTLEGYLRTTAGGAADYLQSSRVTYDALNRVISVVDPQAEIRYQYDANGNRRRVWSYYHDGIDGSMQVQDYWYLYDSLDRFTLTMGELSPTGIVRGASGVSLGYNAASERAFAIYADGHREDYRYTADGYVEDTLVSPDGNPANLKPQTTRFNDLLGRVVKYQEYNPAALPAVVPLRGRTSSYDADSRLISQTEYTGAIGGTVASSTTYDYLDAPGTNNNAGPLASTVNTAGTTTISSYYNYEWWDSAKEGDITAQPYNAAAPGWKSGMSHYTYDLNGHLTQVNDVMGGGSIRLTNDAQGLILRRAQFAGGQADRFGNVSGGTSVNKNHSYYYLDGRRIGDVGNDGEKKVSYAEALARAPISRQEEYKNWRPIASADFDQNYEPIDANYPAATPSVYTVRAGDTLQSIALTVWGDRDLWYLIADANGLSGGTALVPDTALTIPNKVTNLHNNSTTYRVYKPGEIIGDTSPTLPDAPPPPPPPRKKKRFGGLGGIFAAVVAIAAVVVTAGAAAIALGAVSSVASLGAASLGTIFSAGLSVLGGGIAVGGVTAAAAGAFGGATLVASAAIGGAVGNVVSQGVNIAMGLQESFSWKQVAMSAVGSAVSSGVASYFLPAAGAAAPSGWQLAGQAALSNATTQGVNMALGWQEKFNWRSVAASAIVAPIARAVGVGPNPTFGDRLASAVASGVIGYAAQRAVGIKRSFDFTSIAANAIGQSLVGDLAARENAETSRLAVADFDPFGVGVGKPLSTPLNLPNDLVGYGSSGFGDGRGIGKPLSTPLDQPDDFNGYGPNGFGDGLPEDDQGDVMPVGHLRPKDNPTGLFPWGTGTPPLNQPSDEEKQLTEGQQGRGRPIDRPFNPLLPGRSTDPVEPVQTPPYGSTDPVRTPPPGGRPAELMQSIEDLVIEARSVPKISGTIETDHTPERYRAYVKEHPQIGASAYLYDGQLDISIRTYRKAADGSQIRVEGFEEKDQMQKIFDHFGSRVDSVKASLEADNLAHFNRLTGSGVPPEEAARALITSKRIEAAGFKDLEISRTLGTPGKYTKVETIWTRPK